MSYRTTAASTSSLGSQRSIDDSSLLSSGDNSEEEAEQSLYAARREAARRNMLMRAQRTDGEDGSAPLLVEFSPRKVSQGMERRRVRDGPRWSQRMGEMHILTFLFLLTSTARSSAEREGGD
jgi:hypothetical protein